MNYIPIGCPLYQDILQLSDVLHHKDILQSSSFCSETSLILLTCYFNNIPQQSSLHTMPVSVSMKSSRTLACNLPFFPEKNNCRLLLQQFALLYTVLMFTSVSIQMALDNTVVSSELSPSSSPRYISISA